MDFTSLHLFDYIVISIVLLSTLLAFLRGFISTALSFIGWVGSIFVAIYLFPFLQPWMAKYVSHEVVANTLTFMGIYLLSLIIISILNYSITSLIQEMRLGALDRSLGFTFGLARGVALVSILFIGIALFMTMFGMGKITLAQQGRNMEEPLEEVSPDKGPSWLMEAQTYHMLKISSGLVLELVPHDFWNKVYTFAQGMKGPEPAGEKTWKPSTPEMGAVADVLRLLPPGKRQELFKKYQQVGEAEASDSGLQLSKDIIAAYKKALHEGAIDERDQLSVQSVSNLERMLNRMEHASSVKINGKELMKRAGGVSSTH